MSYVICSDSAGDFNVDHVTDLGLCLATLSFTIDGQTYQNHTDHCDMPIKTFYQNLRDGKTATTAAVNVQQFTDLFEPALQAGSDVLYLGFSSGLSTTYQSGEIAAADLREKYPNRKIITIDTLAGSAGQALLVTLACKMQQAGKDIEEVAQWVRDNALKMNIFVIVDDLNHLKRGGRVSTASAVLGSMLSIKPIIVVNNEGKLVNSDKARGRKTAFDKALAAMDVRKPSGGYPDVFVAHSDCLDGANQLIDLVRTKYGTEHIETLDIGPVIGAHTGPGTVVVAFLGTHRD